MKWNAYILKRATSHLSLLLAALCLIASFSARSEAASANSFRKGEVVVEIKPGATIDGINARNRTRTVQRIYGTNIYRLAIPDGKKEKKWRKLLSKDRDVISASLNEVVMSPITSFARPVLDFPDGHAAPGRDKFEYLSQEFVAALKLPDAQLRSRGAGVIVAVIDTGVDDSHPDIASRLWSDHRSDGEVQFNRIDDDDDGLVDDARGWDFVDDDGSPTETASDPQTTVAGHGTFIAGLIALIAPEARIMPVRAFGPDGLSDAFTVAAAIKYAADHGARVINLSFGTPDAPTVLRDAISYARQRGVVLVAAVGNANESTDERPQFPAGWRDDAMGVAAIDMSSKKAGFTNFGADVAVSAPGVKLISTYPGGASGAYAMWSGTSFAAPFASAEAALILAAEPNHADTRKTIEDTAVSIDDMNPGFSGKLGRGRVDPLSALQQLGGGSGPNPPTSNRAEVRLVATGVEPAAQGKAEISIAGAGQEFEIEADNLAVRAPYKIVVDGVVVVDGLTSSKGVTSNFGSFKVEFSNQPHDDHLPLPASITSVDKINHVEIRDAQDRAVLQGDFGAPAAGQPPTGKSVEKEARLAPTGVLPQAGGKARVEIEPEREEFRIEAERLAAGATYQVVVDGVNVGSATALAHSGESGFLRIEFASDGSRDLPLPQSLRPVTRIQHVELRDASNQIVLQGDFQPGSGSIGGDDGDGDGGGSGSGSGSGGSGGGGSGSGGSQEIRKEVRLNRAGVDPNAEGRVRIRVDGSREELEVEASKLDPRVQYVIVVDGHSLDSFTSDGSGSLKVEWSSTDSGKLPLPPEARPVAGIRRVEIRTPSGVLILSGDLPS